MSEHDDLADELESDVDELQEQSDRLKDDIDETRDDWESKKRSPDVPGPQSFDEPDE